MNIQQRRNHHGQNDEAVQGNRAGQGDHPEIHRLINGAPIEALFRSVEHYGETHATARIDYLDISGIAGVAKVIVEDWHGQDYVEYLQLLKENGRWTIISKAFDSYVDTFVI